MLETTATVSMPVDEAAVEQDWERRGFNFGIWTDPPGQVWPDFVHIVDELIMLLEGELEIEVDGSVQRLTPGQEVLVPAGRHHAVRNPGSGANRWLYGYGRLRDKKHK